jgi:uncharacterized protein (DUF4415 family)
MTAKAPVSRRLLKSDLARVDAHALRAEEYKELPELTEEMFARAKVNKGGRPVSPNPRKLISLRLPIDVIEQWKATGAGWQTRMAERLSKGWVKKPNPSIDGTAKGLRLSVTPHVKR